MDGRDPATLDYRWFVRYHTGGDPGAEEFMVAALCRSLRLSRWDAFRLAYFYSVAYNVPDALDMLCGFKARKEQINFRTDRRYVRCGDNYARLMAGLVREKMDALDACRDTQEAYDEVRGWYFFGRYAAFLFLEVWCNIVHPPWEREDTVRLDWNPRENYTKGAEIVTRSSDRAILDRFIERAKRDCRANKFQLETSLCAVEKIRKGTRTETSYTERLIANVRGTRWEGRVIALLPPRFRRICRA